MAILKLKIGEHSRKVKTGFEDVTLRELSDAYKWIHTQSFALKAHLFNGKAVPEAELIEFKINWICKFSDFTANELKLVSFEDLDFVFKQVEIFLKVPEVHLDLKEFKYKGRTFKMIEPLRTISGAKLLFGNANYRQWMLCNQLAKIVENRESANCIEGLTQLLAVIYSDGNESNDALEWRAREFENVNALYGWSAYFFFIMLVQKYKDFFQLYTTPTTHIKMKRKLTLEQSKNELSSSRIGKLLPLKWLKSEYLILEN
jgi:hypothetical protein